MCQTTTYRVPRHPMDFATHRWEAAIYVANKAAQRRQERMRVYQALDGLWEICPVDRPWTWLHWGRTSPNWTN
jgi:hypothetical protein